MSIKQIIMHHNQVKKINLILGLDCQSAIHKFSLRQRLISFDSKLSYVIRELLYVKQSYINNLTMVKIAGYQDNVKRLNALSFLECLNILCDLEAKKLIREQIDIAGNPFFPFQFNSSIVLDRSNSFLVSTEMIKDEIYVQLAAPYLKKKLSNTLMDEIDWSFRKSVIKLLPDSLYV